MTSVLFLTQGLRPGMPAESPAMVFATPTKVVSEAGAAVEYMGANRVPDFQRLFQVTKTCNRHLYQKFHLTLVQFLQ